MYARLITALALTSLAPLFAQSAGGGIAGTIFDRVCHLVASAPVVVRNLDTGAEFSTTRDEKGRYILPVPPGRYDIFVEVAGTTSSERGVKVNDGTGTQVNITVPLP